MSPPPPSPPLFPYTTLFRSVSTLMPPQPLPASLQACRSTGRVLPRGPRIQRTFLVPAPLRSEEHTSELQSRRDLVCRLLLENKNIVERFPVLCMVVGVIYEY